MSSVPSVYRTNESLFQSRIVKALMSYHRKRGNVRLAILAELSDFIAIIFIMPCITVDIVIVTRKSGQSRFDVR